MLLLQSLVARCTHFTQQRDPHESQGVGRLSHANQGGEEKNNKKRRVGLVPQVILEEISSFAEKRRAKNIEKDFCGRQQKVVRLFLRFQT